MPSLRHLVILLAACLPCSLGRPLQAQPQANATSILQSNGTSAQAIERKYIVALKPGLDSQQFDSHMAWVNSVHARSLNRRTDDGVTNTYSIKQWQAYACSFDEETIATIRGNPEVSLVQSNKNPPHSC